MSTPEQRRRWRQHALECERVAAEWQKRGGAYPPPRYPRLAADLATLTPDGSALWKVIKLMRGAETVRRLSEKSGIWSLERTMTAAQELAALKAVTITSDLIAPAQETRP